MDSWYSRCVYLKEEIKVVLREKCTKIVENYLLYTDVKARLEVL